MRLIINPLRISDIQKGIPPMLSLLLREYSAASSEIDQDSRDPCPPDPFTESWQRVMEDLAEEADEMDGHGTKDASLILGRGPSLDDLPEELLFNIFSNFANLPWKRTLYALCLTNHLFRRLATPMLYESYISSKDQYEFVRALVMCPDLAAQVKRLDWQIDRRDPSILPFQLQPFRDEVASKLDEYGAFFTVEAAIALRGGWRRRPGEVGDAYCTAALMHTPNLEHLALKDDRADPQISRRSFQPIKQCLPHSFKLLKSVEINCWAMPLETVADFLRLPSLHSAKFHTVLDEDQTDWGCRPRTSNVKELEFVRCFLYSHNIAKVIESCRALHTFTYSHKNSGLLLDVGGNWFPRINLPLVKTALDAHASTLHQVHIMTSLVIQDYPLIGQLDTFKSYERLASLTVPAPCLAMGDPVHLVEQLPPNLEALYLDDCSYGSLGPNGIKALESLLPYIKLSSGCLDLICIEHQVTGYLTYTIWKDLKCEYRESGITLRIWDLGHPSLLQDDDWDYILDE